MKNLNDIATIVTLVTAVLSILGFAFKRIKKPKEDVPESVYFIKTYGERKKQIYAEHNKNLFIFFFFSIFVVAILLYYEVTFHNKRDTFTGIISWATIISFVVFILTFLVWLGTSIRKAPRLGIYRKVKRRGKFFAYSFGITFGLIVYFAISEMVNDYIINTTKAAFQPLDIAWRGGAALAVLVIGEICLYYSCISIDSREESVALAYLDFSGTGKKRYLHFKEDGKYICTDQPFFDNSKDFIFVNWDEYDFRDIKIISKSVRDQIADIAKITERIQKDNKYIGDDVDSLLEKGNYEKLSDKEVKRVNAYCKTEFPSVVDIIKAAIVKTVAVCWFIIKLLLGILINLVMLVFKPIGIICRAIKKAIESKSRVREFDKDKKLKKQENNPIEEQPKEGKTNEDNRSQGIHKDA
ncbi:hypothetical protein [Butyrivibrio sp. VCB2006]|uniref:hypothetical protein n=1 Tax=Butyrivibrio sp. VCB2006 TaxID=1280679 RepID=UPI00040A12BD|nr:hypothetical protein [Butyrivibrio sp. VCB2006]